MALLELEISRRGLLCFQLWKLRNIIWSISVFRASGWRYHSVAGRNAATISGATLIFFSYMENRLPSSWNGYCRFTVQYSCRCS